MAYTATKTLQPRIFPFPKGFDQTAKRTIVNGTLAEDSNAANYAAGGVGSSGFEVTAFSAVGLVTFSALLGVSLINGQKVVVSNTSSNTNDGTFIVSQLNMITPTSGTFVAIPLPGKALSGSAQTSQTAEGVGQLQFNLRQLLAQTLTITAVSVVGGVMTCTYTTLVGPELNVGDNVTLAGMTNTGNNGTFSLTGVFPTSATAGSFTVNNPNGVTTDSGTATGTFKTGISEVETNSQPIKVQVFTSKGYVYEYDLTNQTVRIFVTGASSAAALSEIVLGANAVFDGTLTFEAEFARNIPN